MSYELEKNTQDIVISGWEKGIAPSPHLGIANMQCANISTETGEVMCNYQRVLASQTPIVNGTFQANNSSSVSYTGSPVLHTGWVQVTASTISGLSTGYYWMSPNGFPSTTFFPYTYYLDAVTPSGLGNTGTATFSTVNMAEPIQNQSATEIYNDSNGNIQTRYYMPDINGHVWCYDTALIGGFFSDLGWSLIGNASEVASSGYGIASGFVVLNGVALLFTNTGTNPTAASIFYKQTSALDASWATATGALNSYLAPHFAMVNHNSFCFYTDGEYLGQILPSSTSASNAVNNWTYGVGVISGGNTFNVKNSSGGYLIDGNFPLEHQLITFYTNTAGSLTNITAGKIYYVVNSSKTAGTFQIETSIGGGAVGSLSNSGTLYFNSFWPNPSTSLNTTSISYQALQLGSFETATCLCEITSDLLIGCYSNNVYNWDETAISGGGSLTNMQLPENYTSSFVQANNSAYIFAGAKGNVYSTNGSFISLALTVPDYTAGIPATPSSYIEPYFAWGGTAFMRGRIWFSVQDQTANKAGNDGGIWSFVPSFFDPVTGQDTGTSLHLEHQNSYSTYNGRASIILPFVNQLGNGAQYYSAWNSDQNNASASFGIDTSGTTPYTGGQTIIDADLIPVGTYFDKTSFSQFEYKLSAPLSSGESVQINWRTDGISAWSSAGSVITETSTTDGSGTIVSGYFTANFQNAQWLQLQAVLTSTATNPSFTRLTELRIISPKD